MRKLNKARLEKTLRDRLAWEIAESRVSAAHLLVLQDGEEVVSICEGVQNLETQEPLRQDAIYRLASMTKPVTGVAALIAEDKGYFNIHDKLEDHMPEFADLYVAKMEGDRVVPGEKSKTPLRIYQLLSHCNGMMAEVPIGNLITDATPKSAFQSLETIVRHTATQPLAFEPETYCAYTGRVSFDVVARLIELKSGMPYATFLQQNIFDPLGLKDFTYHPTDAQWERMLPLTDRVGGKRCVSINMGKHTFEGIPLTYTCAGAGLVASMKDYAIFGEMLRNGGTYKGVQIFRPERMQEYTHPYVGPDVPGRDSISSWGLGVQVKVRNSVLPAGAFGWSGAYGTHFWVDPVNQITAIYMRGSRWYDSHGCGNIGWQFEKDVMNCLED